MKNLKINKTAQNLQITPMPNYIFGVFNYPKLYKYATKEKIENNLLFEPYEIKPNYIQTAPVFLKK